MNKKNLLAIVVVVGTIGALYLPLLASAQTVSTTTSSTTPTISGLEAEIASLLKQLQVLRGQHDQGAASSTPPPPVWSASSTWPTPPPTSHEPSGTPIMTGSSTCMNFPRNLSLGSQGSDVSDLQTMLSQDPSVYPSGAVTGYFGPLTAKAVVQFQEKNDIASSSAGYVGPLTRNFFMKHCGPGPVLPPFTPTNGSSTRPSGTPPYPPMPEHMGSSTFPLPPPPPWTMNGSSTGPGPNGPGNPSGTPPYPIPMPPPHPHPTASSTLTY